MRIKRTGYGKSNQLRTGVEIKFVLDTLPMRFDGLDTQVEGLRRFTRTHMGRTHASDNSESKITLSVPAPAFESA